MFFSVRADPPSPIVLWAADGSYLKAQRGYEQLSALWEVLLICFSIFSPSFSSLILSHYASLPITTSD